MSSNNNGNNGRGFSTIDFPGGYSSDEYFIANNNPELLYDYLVDLDNRFEIERLSSDEDSNIRNYFVVDFLRGTMQYAEQFGIYLWSRLKENSDVVDDFISTTISNYYEAIDEDEIEDFLDDNEVSESYEQRVKSAFNYDYSPDEDLSEVLQPHSGYEQLSDREVRKKIEESVLIINNIIEMVASFYIEFRDFYNAVKHGNRVSFERELEVEENMYLDGDLKVREPYVSALCKKSGSSGGGEAYILNYPLNRMLSRSRYILEEIHKMFEFLHSIHSSRAQDEDGVPFRTLTRTQATPAEDKGVSHQIESTRLGHLIVRGLRKLTSIAPDALKGRLKTIEVNPDSVPATDSREYIEFWSEEVKFILPKTEEFVDSFSVPEPQLAARLSVKNNTLIVGTESDTERSREYPSLISYRPQSRPGARLDITSMFNFNTSSRYMDFKQYCELLKLSEESRELSRVTFKIKNENIEITESCDPESFSYNGELGSLDREIAEFVARLQTITQRNIPLPTTMTQEQAEFLQENMDEVDTRDDAQSVVSELQSLGENVEKTHVFVDVDGDTQHAITFPELVAIEATTEGGRKMTLDEMDSQEPVSLRVNNLPGDKDEVLRDLLENPDKIADVFNMTVPEIDSGEYDLILDHYFHVQQFWYDETHIIIHAE